VLDRAERASLAAFSIMVSHYDLKEQVQYYAGRKWAARFMARVHDSNT